MLALAAVIAVGGCMTVDRSGEPAAPSPAESHALISRLLPPRTSDRVGWATDIYAAFAALKLAPDADNVCAVLAVTEQESTFRTRPTVRGLPKMAWEEIEARAQRLGVPALVVRTALRIPSPNGKSYSERIDAASTEQDLSEIFEDLIGRVPLGSTLFAGWNPVRTGGPMQVSIAFAEEHAGEHTYPYPVSASIRREVFTRHGGMYFGIAHLLGYPASYDKHLYRFADFNAGHYASRNAAFQNALGAASGRALVPDGDLVSFAGTAAQAPGPTEAAARAIATQLEMSDAAIRRDLEQGKSAQFERTRLYRRVFVLAERRSARPVPHAALPRIKLKSPKITRNLTTAWFAQRVDGRYKQCLARVAQQTSARDRA